jgi:hypothetical protein
MTPILNYLNRELYRITHLRGASDLPILYFRLFQVVSILLFIALVFSAIPAMGWSAIGIILTSLISLALNLAAAEMGMRAALQNQPMAVAIAVMLALSHLFSVQFPLSLFGVYSCLNPAAQKRYLRWAPPWVKQLLAKLKMDWSE